MGSKRKSSSHKSSPPSSSASGYSNTTMANTGIHAKQQKEIENLTLTTQPLKTLKYFFLAMMSYVEKSFVYILSHCGWFLLLSVAVIILAIFLLTVDGPGEKHVEELRQYLVFGLWWLALGVGSSIGLGSGLHTFVLYLGPHVALFTIKAMQCGRVDLKNGLYDTIRVRRSPSWLDKDCLEFGPPLFSSLHDSRVPLSSILPQIQVEAMLWGIGTALGELPPYFISRAAQLSGSKLEAMEELDSSSTKDDGVIASRLNKMKHWSFSHAQYLNFFTILLLASVPNPLFDLAGLMCGQFGISFWEFFLATLIGKAVIKTHIQTVFIILVCNNQLLGWIENELIWVFSFIPGLSAILPNLISKLHAAKEKYMDNPPPNVKVKKWWSMSFTSVWNTLVWLMVMNFLLKIVTATAQRYLKRRQELQLDDGINKKRIE